MAADMPLLAVLIDGDNSSPNWAAAIFEEIASLGEASVRRVYGDFSSNQMKGWSERQAGLGLIAHHQPANTVGKNASDIALVIDAMDLLHSSRFHGFVLVSSDSDFTRLAQRIREQGCDVYGIGQQKTPEAFRMACKRFIYVENLAGLAEPAQPERAPLDRGATLVANALGDVEDEEGWAELGQIGTQLSKRYPDFDPRSYGFKKLSELVRAARRFEVSGRDRALKVRMKAKG
ncbi:MAG: NYN domain-containing protein [Pseudomonadota bacterium]